MNCNLAPTTVHAYFDGELDAVRAEEFERHLETCASCQGELKGIQSLHKQLQESDLFEPASPQLFNRIRTQISPQAAANQSNLSSARRRFLIPAFSALAATAAALVIMFLLFDSHSQSTRITAELLDAHVRSLQPGHLTDVLSTDQHTVKPWFDGKLNFIPPVTDFSQQGFPLVGGRLDIIDGHDVAALVYARRKHLINMFAWPYRGRLASSGSGSRQGYNWLRWHSGDMEFYLVSDASAADLDELEKLIRQ